MCYPVKNLRTTDHISLNHLQLDYQGIPLFSILCIQLRKEKRPKRFKTKLQTPSPEAWASDPRTFSETVIQPKSAEV